MKCLFYVGSLFTIKSRRFDIPERRLLILAEKWKRKSVLLRKKCIIEILDGNHPNHLFDKWRGSLYNGVTKRCSPTEAAVKVYAKRQEI